MWPDSISTFQNLIKEMIALDPSSRPTFDALLHNVRGVVFPEVFYSFLHGYVWSINEIPIPAPFNTPTTGISPEILTPASSAASTAASTAKGGSVTPLHAVDTKVPEAAVPRDADHKIEKIWADYESVEPYLLEDTGEDTITDVRVDYVPAESQGKPFQVCLSQMIEYFSEGETSYVGHSSCRIVHSKQGLEAFAF
jgi:phosphoinositide-3-kinase, regulatory subunit 4